MTTARIRAPFAGVAFVLAAGVFAQSEGVEKWRETPAKLHPKEVKYTAAIEPAKAKPGDTVTYKVSVQVAEPWHIYAWAEKQPEEGPRSTQFNLYDTGGLTAGAEWKSDKEPELAAEPAFPNLKAVAFHEKGVVWSMPLTIPKDAKPGSVTVKGQMLFQICNEGACKAPTKVGLPDATVTIE